MTAGTHWLNDEEQASWRAYLRASRQLWVQLDRDLQREFDLSLAEYEIMSMVSEAPGRRLRMSALAQIVVQSRSRLTHTAKRLEERGLVERVPVTDDRRGVELVLLDSGMALVNKASHLHVQGVREHLIDLLDPQQFAALGAASARISEHLSDVPVSAPNMAL
ncbi:MULTISPECIES: MarR family winged helix-turn-helix transcriptional regulator [Barrientosiimonas]|uniref:MarR family transcriptional regulator n=1 Tax=Barrientosiimonas endolithica TaxID=1535208 RepID=A0ABM8H7A7_9MICO|nr:MarR family transcriptional regulator [Barrientosiimonas endolithica]BDZ56717.1 MarR family transcriptional regulator [Barrientosiimonas endolithica]